MGIFGKIFEKSAYMSSRNFLTIFLFAGLMGILFIGCEPIPRQNGSTATTPGAGGKLDVTEPISNIIDFAEKFSIDAQELTKPKKIRAWVDGLIVTQQPGMKDLEIAKMKAGEEAEYMYQSTLRKVTRTLRGQNFNERYILITTKDGQLGWVHEGGVRYVRPAFEQLVEQFLTPSDPNKRTRGPSLAPALDFRIIPGQSVGPIRKSSSEGDLVQIYGAGQVHRGFTTNPENPSIPCTVVMPATPNEIKIVWENADRTRVKEVHFLKENSNWFTPEGLSSGLAFSELIKANKAPISFHGFNWKYSGTVSSWGKGSLSRYANKFYTILKPRIPMAQVPSRFIGDKVLSSNMADLDGVYIYVEKLVVYLD